MGLCLLYKQHVAPDLKLTDMGEIKRAWVQYGLKGEMEKASRKLLNARAAILKRIALANFSSLQPKPRPLLMDMTPYYAKMGPACDM